jgi:crotonobetainyl-CoA:carnitine CoA-transferase CaiB-like acyl-CoA transferase
MYDGSVAWLSLHAPHFLFDRIEPRGGEQAFIGQAPCYNVYRCADGRDVALGIIEEHFWHRFCDAVRMPDLKDEQWPTGEAAVRQKAQLQALFETRSRDEWVAFLEPADIPFGPSLSMEEAFAHPQSHHRAMLQTVDHPVEGTIPQLGFAVKYSDTPCSIRTPPPLLGQHSDTVLREIGLSDAEIAELRAAGVIGPIHVGRKSEAHSADRQ